MQRGTMVAIFPLVKNRPDLVTRARAIYTDLQEKLTVVWDDRGNIGKRYLAQDEIGTPFCLTVDYQTLDDQSVTIRKRDDASQERVATSALLTYLQAQL